MERNQRKRNKDLEKEEKMRVKDEIVKKKSEEDKKVIKTNNIDNEKDMGQIEGKLRIMHY